MDATTITPAGRTFDPALDADRLAKQARAVFYLMRDGHWRTLGLIAACTGAPEASVSARLRDLRRAGLTVERRRIEEASGLWTYRVVL